MAYKKFENSLSQDINVMNVIVLKYCMQPRYSDYPMTFVANARLSRGILPDVLQVARTVPVFKKGITYQTTSSDCVFCNVPHSCKLWVRSVGSGSQPAGCRDILMIQKKAVLLPHICAIIIQAVCIIA